MPRSYADFARPTYREPRWLETQWFSAMTTSGIRLHFWMGFRTNLGVAVSKVYAYSGMCESVLDMDMADMQYHAPIGASRLSDFALLSGVTVRGRKVPDRYTLTYRSKCGRMTAELEFSALMAPADLSLTAVRGAERGFTAFHGRAADSLPENRTGEEPYGHIDQTMKVAGLVSLDGEHHEVDCVANRDHSWSPRAEFRHGTGTFDLFHFGSALTLLTHTGAGETGPYVSNAYVLAEGQVRAVVRAEVDYRRDGFRTTEVRYVVEDTEGRSYDIRGTQRASAVIDGGQNILLVMDLLDATWDGHTGYGEIQWHDDIMRLQGVRRRARIEAGVR